MLKQVLLSDGRFHTIRDDTDERLSAKEVFERENEQRRTGVAIDVIERGSQPNVESRYTVLTLLKFTCILLMLLQTTLFVYFVVNDIFHGHMLTWWNQVLVTGFLVVLTFSIFVEGWALWLTVVWLLPVVAALAMNINVAIVVIISQNGEILDSPDLSESDEYVGNWLIHTLDMIIIWAALLNAGLLLLARAIIGDFWRKLESHWQRALYAAYFGLGPLVVPAVYTAIWPISRHYPTGIPDWLAWLCLVALNAVVQQFLFACIVLDDRVSIDVPTVTSLTTWLRLGGGVADDPRVQPHENDNHYAAQAQSVVAAGDGAILFATTETYLPKV